MSHSRIEPLTAPPIGIDALREALVAIGGEDRADVVLQRLDELGFHITERPDADHRLIVENEVGRCSCQNGWRYPNAFTNPSMLSSFRLHVEACRSFVAVAR